MISWCYTCFRLLKTVEELARWVEINRFSFHTLENVAIASDQYVMKADLRLRLVLRWCLFLGQI